MQDYPRHVEQILHPLYEHRLALFSDAELEILERDLASADGDVPLRELLRSEIEWARHTRRCT
jgi:hypothetical protein